MKIRLLLATLILLGILFPIVSAACVIEKQGDVVYLGEYCDVSKVVGWKSTFAYFSGGYESDTPTKTVEVTGFMYRHYIDPNKYVVGTWYKWEGMLERGGNNLAFVVKEGKRNETPVNLSANVTPVPTKKPGSVSAISPKDQHLLIARGDDGVILYGLDSGAVGGVQQDGFLWLFGSGTVKTQVLDFKMNYSSADGGHRYDFSPSETDLWDIGHYTGYIQFVGKNGRQDVFYSKTNNSLDSPYKSVPAVALDGLLPTNIRNEFVRLVNQTDTSDDFLIPITMDVAVPDVVIKNYWEEADEIVIEGTTTMSEGTVLVVQVDPDHYALANEVAANKHVTEAEGGIGELRTFSVRFPLQWDEMKIGQHKIRVNINTYKIDTSIDKDFEVTGTWVNPTQTPEMRKVIISSGGSHMVDVNGTAINSTGIKDAPTIVTPPTPTPIPTPTPTPANMTHTPTRTPTPPPTPDDNVDLSKVLDNTGLPVNPAIPILAVFGAVLIFIIRRR